MKKYRIKVTCDVVVSAVGVALGATAIATAAAGNIVGIVAGAITTAKSLSKGAQAIRNYAKSAEDVYIELWKEVMELDANYKDMGKLAVTGKEIFAKAVEIFTTKTLASIKSCEAKVATFRTKLTPFEKEAHKAARELNELLDSVDDLTAAIKKSGVQDLIKHSNPELTKLEDSVAAALENIHGLVDKVNTGKLGAKAMEEKLAELDKKVSNGLYKGVTWTLAAADLGVRVWGGLGGPESIDGFCSAAVHKINAITEHITHVEYISGKYAEHMYK
jgi:hypothetical protein